MIAGAYCGSPVGGFLPIARCGPHCPHFVRAFATVNTPYGVGALASLVDYTVDGCFMSVIVGDGSMLCLLKRCLV